MKYTIHKRSEQKVVGGFDHKADAVNAITGLIDAAKVTDDWQDGDYMTVRGDGHILSYLPAQRVTKDEFGNSFTSPATPEDILTDILREQGKADIKVLESYPPGPCDSSVATPAMLNRSRS